MAKQAIVPSEQLKGTVADLAGRISVNGGEPLNQQDMQFLTRILRDTGFAKAIDTAPASGKRGGKRATVWQLMPNIKISLSEAANVPATKTKSTVNHAPAIDTSSPEFRKAVQAEVRKAIGAQAAQAVTKGKRGAGKAAGK
jgi:organic radical activating enzyme